MPPFLVENSKEKKHFDKFVALRQDFTFKMFLMLKICGFLTSFITR